MMSKPEKEHEWLQQLVGEWSYEHTMPAEPGKPAETFSGTESVRSLGGLWVVAEGRGEMPGGGAATMLLTLGYDPTRKRFVGTWVGSMMTHLWVYDGWLNEAGNTLTLETEGPSFTEAGKLTKFREVIEMKDRDTRTFRSTMLRDDGEWATVMSATYRRTK
jgi:hypothetical protein